MQGMAYQKPEKAEAPKKGAGKKPEQNKEKKGLMQGLQNLPVPAGIAALVICCALALPVGNMRALQNATPKDFLRQGDVQSIVVSRTVAADNAMTTAKRAGNIDEEMGDVQAAIAQMSEAETAREISRADQALQLAVSQMADAARDGLDAEGRTMLQRALDDFTEQGNFLRQEAREYNEKAEEAQKVYDGLLLRGLFDEPDRYEGL